MYRNHSMVDEEVEIKIEYFDSTEVDPLQHEDQKIYSNFNTTTKIISAPKNEGSKVSQLNVENYTTESENIAKWHKTIDKFGKFVCKYCENSYSTVQTLRYHVKMKHNHNFRDMKLKTLNNLRQTKLKCHICNTKFKNNSELQLHTETEHSNDKENFCMVCQASFKDQIDFSNHMTNAHKLVKRTLHICPVCRYSTAKIYHYKQHLNIHESGNKNKCKMCDYSTNRLTNLRIHERIHSKDKSFACNHENCNYHCASKSALLSHQLKHKKQNMLYCDKCNYCTVYMQSLKKHIDSHKRNNVRKVL